MTATRAATVLPDAEESALARASAGELSRLLAERSGVARARVQLDGHELILPRSALSLLRDLLTELAAGNAVTVVPTHAQLTTQEAANLLGVSRPHLIKLLESGELEYHMVGKHRRISFPDLTAYKQVRDSRSRDALDELTREAQELGLGY